VRLVLDVGSKDSSQADVTADLERPQVELLRLLGLEQLIVLEQLEYIDTEYHPAVGLDSKRNLERASVDVFELFVDVAERDLGQAGLVHHVVQVHHAVLAFGLVYEQVDILPGQSQRFLWQLLQSRDLDVVGRA